MKRVKKGLMGLMKLRGLRGLRGLRRPSEHCTDTLYSLFSL